MKRIVSLTAARTRRMKQKPPRLNSEWIVVSGMKLGVKSNPWVKLKVSLDPEPENKMCSHTCAILGYISTNEWH